VNRRPDQFVTRAAPRWQQDVAYQKNLAKQKKCTEKSCATSCGRPDRHDQDTGEGTYEEAPEAKPS